MRIKKQFPAISVLEVLLAGGILAMILGSTVTLSRTINRNQLINQDRTMAISLAAEAAELIRSARDTSYINNISDQYDSFINPNCKNKKCDIAGTSSQELIWDSTNKWMITQDDPLVSTDPHYDLEKTGELILVDLQSGQISDNKSRLNPSANNPGDVQAPSHYCGVNIPGYLVFCRRILIAPVAYDKDGRGVFDDNDIPTNADRDGNGQPDPDDLYFLPLTTFSTMDSTIVKGEKERISFYSWLNNAYKVIVEVSWLEGGFNQRVQVSDTITNWKWID